MKWLLSICTALIAAPLAACCMVPISFPGDVDQSGQQALIFHNNGHEELILRVAPFFQDAENAPEYLAWVVTVPSKPTGYEKVKADVFDKAQNLYRMLEDKVDARTNNRGHAEEDGVDLKGEGLEISEMIKVGPYEITEVKAIGKEALTALNAYLKERDFPAEDPDHMKYFVENDFTFLCIYIRPPEKDGHFGEVGEDLDLPALQIGFDTKKPYYPGMFSSQQGSFKLAMTTITSTPLKTKALKATRKRLNAYADWDNLWTAKPLDDKLKAVIDASDDLKGVECWYVNAFPSWGFNETGKDGKPAISLWKEDVFFTLGGEDDVIPKAFYKGDGERPKIEASNDDEDEEEPSEGNRATSGNDKAKEED